MVKLFKITIILIGLLNVQLVNAQPKTYTFEEVEALKEPRPIVIFLHAKWCKYCRVMENITLENKEVIEKLNNNYYFIAFDAEQKEPITFQNNIFKYKATGRKTGVHELAEVLGTYEFKITYPTTIVLNKKMEIIFQYPSALRPKGFLRMLSAIEADRKL